MMMFAVLMAVPLLVALGGFVLTRTVSWKEFGAQVVVQAIVAASAAGIVSCQNTTDTEIWNGVVASKWSEHVSCEHSYQCNCITTSCGKGCTTTTCSTCYDHPYDVDWNVRTSNGENVAIHRVDRQGISEPPRFTAVRIGEPTAIEHDFVNYVKAAPDSLFRHEGLVDRYAGHLPAYPGHVTDYYRLNRLVLVGTGVDDANAWAQGLAELNGEVGRARQANVILVLVKGLEQDYFYALEQAWVGGKKNDVVLVVGVDDNLAPRWASVMCWTTEEIFRVQLRDAVMSGGVLTKDKILGDIRSNLPTFKRKPMADFQYLEASITPSPLQWGIAFVLSLAIAIGLMVLSIQVDVFGDELPNRFR